MTLKPRTTSSPGCAGLHVGTVVVDDADLDAGDRPPDGAGDHLRRIVVPAHADGPGGLGHPVAGDDGPDAEDLAHLADHLDGHDRRAGDRRAHARQVEGSRRSGWSRIVWKTVGGPGSIVIRSSRPSVEDLRARRTRAAGRMVAPRSTHASTPGLQAGGVEERDRRRGSGRRSRRSTSSLHVAVRADARPVAEHRPLRARRWCPT